MLDFVRAIISVRKSSPVFRRQKFFQGRSIRGNETNSTDVRWISPSGKDATDEEWSSPSSKCIGLWLDGQLLGEVDDQGQPIVGDTVLLMLNSHHENIRFLLPTPTSGAFWEPLVDTAQFPGQLSETQGGSQYLLFGRSIALLRLSTPAIEEKQKEGFVAAELIAESAKE